jgi:hypothetical protein
MILKNIKLDVDFDFLLSADYSQHYGSCISYQKREQEDIHEDMAKGFPKSYHEENTVIQQIWFDDGQVDYADLGRQLNMEVITVSTILQPPGNVITLHRDTFFQIKKKYPERAKEKMVRANVYLEDWKPGHIIQYKDLDNEWKNSTHWTQGDGFLWDSDILHIGANIGLTPKYTLQISGFYKGE